MGAMSAERGQIMKQAMKRVMIALPALILSLSTWPSAGTLAAVKSAHLRDAAITPQFIGARAPLRFAKHQDDDRNQGYEQENEGKHHHKHGKHKENAAEERDEKQQFCGPYFKSSYVPYFRNYYSQNDYTNLSPGLRKHIQKTGHLPPGLEKKYERTGQLPPGLQKRFECGQTLPPDYSRYLYPVPDSAYQRVGQLPPDSKLYLFGNDLVLLNYHTRAIIDILRGAY
jgi:Ni/Co efflux regulator RcnB